MINPGNPVGAVLSEAAVAELICFAAAKGLVVLADEVYQLNVYAEGAAFYSCKQVLRKLQAGVLKPPELERGAAVCGPAELAAAQLISFHSTSKGLIGECGQRGGYLEMVGFSDATRAQFTKVTATSLSSGMYPPWLCLLWLCLPWLHSLWLYSLPRWPRPRSAPAPSASVSSA